MAYLRKQILIAIILSYQSIMFGMEQPETPSPKPEPSRITQPDEVILHAKKKFTGKSFIGKDPASVTGSLNINFGSLYLNNIDLITHATYSDLLKENSTFGLPLVIFITEVKDKGVSLFRAVEAYSYLNNIMAKVNSDLDNLLGYPEKLPAIDSFTEIITHKSLVSYPSIFAIWPHKKQGNYLGILSDPEAFALLTVYATYDYIKSNTIVKKLEIIESKIKKFIKESRTFKETKNSPEIFRLLNIALKIPPDKLDYSPYSITWLHITSIINNALNIFLIEGSQLNESQLKKISSLILDNISKTFPNEIPFIKSILALLLSTQKNLVPDALKLIPDNEFYMNKARAKILILNDKFDEVKPLLETISPQDRWDFSVPIWQAFINLKTNTNPDQSIDVLNQNIAQNIDWKNYGPAILGYPKTAVSYFDALLNKAQILIDRNDKKQAQALLEKINNPEQLEWIDLYQLYRAKKLREITQKKED